MSRQAGTHATRLGRNLLQQEVDGPVNIPMAVMKSHHALVLISAGDLNELKRHTRAHQLEKGSVHDCFYASKPGCTHLFDLPFKICIIFVNHLSQTNLFCRGLD